MADGALGTTNLLLGALVAVSLAQALAFVWLAVIVVRLQNRLLQITEDVHTRVLPTIARLDRLTEDAEHTMADLRAITTAAASGMRQANTAFQATAAVMGLAAGGVRGKVGRRVRRLAAAARGLRVAYRVLAGASGVRVAADNGGAEDSARTGT